MFLPLYALKKTRDKGLGLFAIQEIPARTIIMECPYLAYQGDLAGTALEHYQFTFPYTQKGEYTEFSHQSAVVFGEASLLNHSDDANCEWDWLPKRRLHRTRAVKKILVGQELTFDYNWHPEVWTSVGGQK